MTIEDEAYEEAEDLADQIGVAIEFALLSVIASRLGSITESTTYADAVFYETVDFAKMEEIAKRGRVALDRSCDMALNKIDKINREWAKPYFEARKLKFESPNIFDKVRNEIKGRTSKMVNTSVMRIVDINGEVTTMPRGYRKAVSNAIAMMKSGREAYQTAIAKTVKQLSRFGVRVQYEKGSTRELYAAVRTNIMDGYQEAMSLQRQQMGVRFGADGVEVTAHLLCAKDHQEYQGKQYSYERRDGYELWSDIQFQPDRPLVIGANCRHDIIPVILGVSKPAYSSEELDAMRGYSNSIIEVNGLSGKTLHMTRYEATQYQRNIEREIRRYKGEARLMDDSSLPDLAKAASKRARDLTTHYNIMSDLANLGTRPERTRLYKM